MRIEKKKWIALLVALPLSQAFGYQSGFEFLGPLLLGSTVTGVAASMTGGGLLLANTGRAAMPIVASALLGVGVAGTFTFANLHKELMNQLKVDHDTYLAGGEMTPILQNLYTRGASWRAHGITATQVRTRNGPIAAEGAPARWAHVDARITEAVREGVLPE